MVFPYGVNLFSFPVGIRNCMFCSWTVRDYAIMPRWKMLIKPFLVLRQCFHPSRFSTSQSRWILWFSIMQVACHSSFLFSFSIGLLRSIRRLMIRKYCFLFLVECQPFQELSFLLRDYPNFEDRSNIELCCHQGRERLSEYMNETQSREARVFLLLVNW